jgi:hypothetical protein
MKYLGLPLAIKRLKRIHFQPLEDKVATKLIPWMGKHVTMASHSALVKSVLTSIVIYYVTVLNIPVGVLFWEQEESSFLGSLLDKWIKT